MKKFFLGFALLSMASLSLAGCLQQEEETTPVADDAAEDVVEPDVDATVPAADLPVETPAE